MGKKRKSFEKMERRGWSRSQEGERGADGLKVEGGGAEI